MSTHTINAVILREGAVAYEAAWSASTPHDAIIDEIMALLSDECSPVGNVVPRPHHPRPLYGYVDARSAELATLRCRVATALREADFPDYAQSFSQGTVEWSDPDTGVPLALEFFLWSDDDDA